MGKPNIDVISQTNEVLFAICFHNFASVAVTRKFTNAVLVLSRNHNRRKVSKNYLCHDLSLQSLAPDGSADM